MIDRAELATWLRLVETAGVGRETARRLLSAFGSPASVFDASHAERESTAGSAIAHALDSPPDGFEALLAATMAWLDAASQEARDVIVLGDPRYPTSLLNAADPPLLLYARGRIELIGRPSIAVVGSRNPTPQGLENARAFAAHLSRSGYVIVSGLALGVDGAAHEGGLEGGAGTIAVVGTGLDRIYPARHQTLARRIVENGLLLSEFAVGTPALAPNFPIRNRIIAGLADATLVVEAALQSGSLITARLATESGRDVFAIPGSIHSPQSRGCHALIKQGAKLVDAAVDILEELGGSRIALLHARADGPAGDESVVAQTPKVDPLIAALGFDPIGLDELVARTGRSAATLSAQLLELELAGRVARLPGQLFQRIERA